MKSKNIVELLKKKLLVFVCLLLIFIMGGLGMLGIFDDVDNSIYDALLRFTPEPPVAQEIVFVDIYINQ